MFSDLYARLIEIRERATPQVKRPFYIGLGVGFALAVLVLLGLLNTGSFVALPSSFDGVATSQAIWGLKPSNLLMVLPLGAFLVVLARSFIGLKAFGLFTPMLIALAFLQIGPVMGPVVLCSSIFAGMIVTPQLQKLRMTRVGFLGVLISLITLVLVALQMVLDTQLQVDAFPVIVCALCVERWWKQWEKDGAKPAAWMAFNTFILAVVIEFVMVSNVAMMLIEWSPLLMPATTGVAIAILGRYRGLRLSEIKRFAPIWLERRRQAKAAELPEGVAEDRRKGLPDSRRIAVDDEAEAKPAQPPPIAVPASERAPPKNSIWVIHSSADLEPFGQDEIAAIEPVSTPAPNREAQFVPRFGASATEAKSKKPKSSGNMKPKTWIIRKPEDV
jgi:hypothetical protein